MTQTNRDFNNQDSLKEEVLGLVKESSRLSRELITGAKGGSRSLGRRKNWCGTGWAHFHFYVSNDSLIFLVISLASNTP